MPSAYLTFDDYLTFGLPLTTTDAQVTQASTMVDTYLKRKEGLVWTPDATGLPCYMTAAKPGATLTATSGIAAGSLVTVPVTGPILSLEVGDVLILDRASPSLTEAVTVTGWTPGVSIILRSVLNNHTANALLEGGLVIQEEKKMPHNRPLTILSKAPVCRIVSGSGRYGYSRRGDAGASSINDFNLLAAFSQFGGPPVWEVFDPAVSDVNPSTGELWIPAGIMLAYYTDVRVRYVAGYTAAGLPDEIKFATARTIGALLNAPNLGAVKSYKAGGSAIEMSASSVITDDVKEMLAPFKARLFA